MGCSVRTGVAPDEDCHIAVVGPVAVGTIPVTGVPVTVTPPIDVAAIVPDPLAARLAPLPTVIAADVLVPDVMPEKDADDEPQVEPASAIVELLTHLTQLFGVTEPDTPTPPPGPVELPWPKHITGASASIRAKTNLLMVVTLPLPLPYT